MEKKRTRDEYRKGPGTRGPTIRQKRRLTPVVAAELLDLDNDPLEMQTFGELETKAEETLTNLGEQEAAAESENETGDLDSVHEVPPGSVNGEASPAGYGSIDR